MTFASPPLQISGDPDGRTTKVGSICEMCASHIADYALPLWYTPKPNHADHHGTCRRAFLDQEGCSPPMVVGLSPDLRSADHRAEEENGAAGRPTAVCMCHDGPHGWYRCIPHAWYLIWHVASVYRTYGTRHGGWALRQAPDPDSARRLGVSGSGSPPVLVRTSPW